ncbi:hypothetical protein [Streptomyces sp. JJ38]|uniref:hypothetical protein n=1 Tax=Streptomyces sp. JJ38 TaxID=2738128 RepID=UPI001C598740|nr:hypothetical protein [Streptomyces sp. JJ38]MBW1599748.1 hypothetical protein [Streptomyces sp. JJ38]
MKRRRGWAAIGNTGTAWWGDCPRWADAQRAAGLTVATVVIIGRRWPCTFCQLHLTH